MEAMIASIRWNDYCKYPPPEGFPRLRELIMEDPEAVTYVNNYAEDSLNFFLSRVDMVTDQDVLDELRCQYQCQAWRNVFKEVML